MKIYEAHTHTRAMNVCTGPVQLSFSCSSTLDIVSGIRFSYHISMNGRLNAWIRKVFVWKFTWHIQNAQKLIWPSLARVSVRKCEKIYVFVSQFFRIFFSVMYSGNTRPFRLHFPYFVWKFTSKYFSYYCRDSGTYAKQEP